MTVKSIHIQNYRGFSDPVELQLRPITILIGRNSSGKSSLLRLIPLLQQSLDKPGSVPILWDSELVDMGSISDVISRSAPSKGLTLGFTLSTNAVILGLDPFSYFQDSEEPSEVDIEYKVHLDNVGGKTFFNGFELSLHGLSLKVRWDHQGFIQEIECNSLPIDLDGVSYSARSNDLFPIISRILTDEEMKSRRARLPFFPALERELTKIFHGKTSEAKIGYFRRRVWFQPRESFEKDISSFPHIIKKRLTKDIVDTLHVYSFIHDLPEILAIIESEITSCFKNSAYIGPARARSERFSKMQELSVDRLSAGGDNTAMYLHSLDTAQRKSFNELMLIASGHRVEIEESGPSHVSMKVGIVDGTFFENVSDVGFGFSQVIPVVAQMHAVLERRVKSENYAANEAIYAVEQPELHLHPAMQGNLADLFVHVAELGRNQGYGVKIIAETHSENLISKLGRLVAAGLIDREDVSIVFVEKGAGHSASSIRSMQFDEDGLIDEWPVGFFSS